MEFTPCVSWDCFWGEEVSLLGGFSFWSPITVLRRKVAFYAFMLPQSLVHLHLSLIASVDLLSHSKGMPSFHHSTLMLVLAQ